MNDIPLAAIGFTGLVGAFVCTAIQWVIVNNIIWKQLKADPPPGITPNLYRYWRMCVVQLVENPYFLRWFGLWFVGCVSLAYAVWRAILAN